MSSFPLWRFSSSISLKYAHRALGGDAAYHDQQIFPCERFLYFRKPSRLRSASSTPTITTPQKTALCNTPGLLVRTAPLNLPS